MLLAARLQAIEDSISIINNILSATFIQPYYHEFRDFAAECRRRLEILEARFDLEHLDQDDNVFTICKKQEKIILRKRLERAVYQVFDHSQTVREENGFLSSSEIIQHQDLFRVKDRNISEISPECLSELTLLIKEYDRVSLNECFMGCKNVTRIEFPLGSMEINISCALPANDLSNVINMGGMFRECENLSTLDLSTFNTSNVTDMRYMFRGCGSLTTLDLSTFDTSNVQYMECMFFKCKSITSLKLSTFNTSSVRDMSHMFQYCSSLTSLELSTFNTSSVKHMRSMFSGCSKLREVYVDDTRIKFKLPSGVNVRAR